MEQQTAIAHLCLSACMLTACVARSVVPTLDPTRIHAATIEGLGAPSLRLRLTDERFISPADKQNSVTNVRAAASAALVRVGISVNDQAANDLVISFQEPTAPYGDFSTDECVSLTATLRAKSGRWIQANGIGCAHQKNLFGTSVGGDTTVAFETALNLLLGELGRLSHQSDPSGPPAASTRDSNHASE